MLKGHPPRTSCTGGIGSRAGITDLEIGLAARSLVEWDSLTRALDVVVLVGTTAEHVQCARIVQRLLAEEHQRGRKNLDLPVAAAAEAYGLTVLHYYADFDPIAESRNGQPSGWSLVVPPMSDYTNSRARGAEGAGRNEPVCRD